MNLRDSPYCIHWKLVSEKRCRVLRIPGTVVSGKELRNMLMEELGMASVTTRRCRDRLQMSLVIGTDKPDIHDSTMVSKTSAVLVRRLPVRSTCEDIWASSLYQIARV